MAVGIAAGMWATYGSAERRGRLAGMRGVVAPRVGIAWGLMVAGMWLVTVLFVSRGSAASELLGALWGYVLGVGFLLLGILSPVFVIVALLGIVGAPLTVLVGGGSEVLAALFVAMSLVMLGVGVAALRQKAA